MIDLFDVFREHVGSATKQLATHPTTSPCKTDHSPSKDVAMSDSKGKLLLADFLTEARRLELCLRDHETELCRVFVSYCHLTDFLRPEASLGSDSASSVPSGTTWHEDVLEAFNDKMLLLLRASQSQLVQLRQLFDADILPLTAHLAAPMDSLKAALTDLLVASLPRFVRTHFPSQEARQALDVSSDGLGLSSQTSVLGDDVLMHARGLLACLDARCKLVAGLFITMQRLESQQAGLRSNYKRFCEALKKSYMLEFGSERQSSKASSPVIDGLASPSSPMTSEPLPSPSSTSVNGSAVPTAGIFGFVSHLVSPLESLIGASIESPSKGSTKTSPALVSPSTPSPSSTSYDRPLTASSIPVSEPTDFEEQFYGLSDEHQKSSFLDTLAVEHQTILSSFRSQESHILGQTDQALSTISQLQGILSGHIEQQAVTIDKIYDDVQDTLDSISAGYDSLKRAKENSDDLLKTAVWLLLILSFAILFLDWFN